MANTGKFIILAAFIAIAAGTNFEDAKDKAMGMFSKKIDVGPEPGDEKQMDSRSEKKDDEEDDGLAKIRIKAIVKGILLIMSKIFKLIGKLVSGILGKDKPWESDSWGNSKFGGAGSDAFGKLGFDLKDFGSKFAPADHFGVLGVLKDYLKERLFKD